MGERVEILLPDSKDMKAVIQRVSEASVSINEVQHAVIGQGVLILVGIEEADVMEDVQWLSKKIVQMRIFNDSSGIMNLSVNDIDGEVMIISQFTLHAATKKGNRPSYIKAAKHETAIPLYEAFVKEVGNQVNQAVKTGIFAADMKVHLINDGPVTIIIDTKNRE